jgi:hypothetical protein
MVLHYSFQSGMNRRMENDRRNLGRNRMGSDNRTGYERKNAPVSKSPKNQKEEKDKKDVEAEKPNGDVKTEPTDDSKR